MVQGDVIVESGQVVGQTGGETRERVCKLDVTTLWSYDSGKEVKLTSYGRNGCDPARLKTLLQGERPCPCNCHKKFSLRELRQLCESFWRLDKAHQDKALWSAACAGEWSDTAGHESGSDDSSNGSEVEEAADRRRRSSWQLGGNHVCRQAFCNLLGTVGAAD